ncbi:copper homeostasis protein CutC [Listeria costaricensis]|uniref:copper homeostasis protein CutC n=1 Tax=Listeria costaricensis TaxID=2026604 RepID=UPI000C06F83F|nr:copper homeostasis protein CutC [Listeria costaricensis]
MLEVIVQSGEDARCAEAFGADRMEVVQAISEGGLTPSYGVMKDILKQAKIPAMMMIRPHSFSFVYNEADRRAILLDIELAKELGVQGIVFGALTEEGEIDRTLLEAVIRAKGDLDLTFHRALEDARDIEASYLVLREYGHDITQILTSGGTASAVDSIPRLKRWIADSAADPASFKILVGSGVTPDNIASLHQKLENEWYHVGGGARISGDFSQPLDQKKIKQLKVEI